MITNDDPTEHDHFEFVVTQTSKTIGKLKTMSHNNSSSYIGKGIAEAMLQFAHFETGLTIESSTNKSANQVLETEWRSTDATQFWERMVNVGKASHDASRDVYTYIMP